MGHAYLAADGCDEAEVLGIMSSADDELLQSLMAMHEEQAADAVALRKRSSVRDLPHPQPLADKRTAPRRVRSRG